MRVYLGRIPWPLWERAGFRVCSGRKSPFRLRLSLPVPGSLGRAARPQREAPPTEAEGAERGGLDAARNYAATMTVWALLLDLPPELEMAYRRRAIFLPATRAPNLAT